MSKQLDHFGQSLMSSVRDEAIEQWQSLIDGKLKGDTAKRLRPEIAAMTAEDRALLKRLVPRIVDTTLHHLLWSLEQSDDIRVAVELDKRTVNVAEESDGLPGELQGSNGWIARFSRYGREE